MTNTASQVSIELDVLLKAYEQMVFVSELATIFEDNRDLFKFVHSTSRGHEAIQLAVAFQLLPCDYVYPYYRDESILLGIGMTPYEMLLQNLAKRDDPFSGGRHYYAHPSLRREKQPKVPYQSSSTGMQAIPATGAAHGMKYKEKTGLVNYALTGEVPPVVVCSMGDGSVTEGEVSEAFQMAVLHSLPIIYLVQDNDWSISTYTDEFAAMNAYEYAQGFKGLEAVKVDGSDFLASYEAFHRILQTVRAERRPFLLHAKVPLIGHHTSGVRREWYRPQDEYNEDLQYDPFLILKKSLLDIDINEGVLQLIEDQARAQVRADFERAKLAPDPDDIHSFYYMPTPITEERGERTPAGGKEIVMVDAALHAMDDILRQHPEALLYGQDVGGRLGGVFREAATLTQKYGSDRVFNTPIQEAYIVGSTSGMSAVGLKPVVEIQFADYVWPGLNQLFTELSRSYYLSYGKWNVQSLIRVPIGAYGSGGPFHSSSVESVLLNIHGVKVVYPSNAADMKGLFKAAFYDPNPVVILEHKGLYWSKVPGSKEARTIEPDEHYIIPLGKGRIWLEADPNEVRRGNTCVIITYGMGVHWAKNAVMQHFPGQVEIIDLRTLEPLDWELIESSVKKHGKAFVLTEENPVNSFAEALAGRISRVCFRHLDAPVALLGSENTPCIPLNSGLEAMVLPSADKVARVIRKLLEE
jgi:2-oxoisovalerate dehydrogenase E1 component